MPWKDLNHIPGGKGNVEKESNFAWNVFLFCHLANGGGSQHKVVVMNPHQWHIIWVLDVMIKGHCYWCVFTCGRFLKALRVSCANLSLILLYAIQ